MKYHLNGVHNLENRPQLIPQSSDRIFTYTIYITRHTNFTKYELNKWGKKVKSNDQWGKQLMYIYEGVERLMRFNNFLKRLLDKQEKGISESSKLSILRSYCNETSVIYCQEAEFVLYVIDYNTKQRSCVHD